MISLFKPNCVWLKIYMNSSNIPFQFWIYDNNQKIPAITIIWRFNFWPDLSWDMALYNCQLVFKSQGCKKCNYVYGLYIVLCWSVKYSILTLFVWTLLIILFHNTFATPLVTSTCTPIAPPYLYLTHKGYHYWILCTPHHLLCKWAVLCATQWDYKPHQ